MKVWLDDVRDAPEGWVRTYWPAEVILLLETGDVTELSLDWNLAGGYFFDPPLTGETVLDWLEEAVPKGFQLPTRMRAHTGSHDAKWRMKNRIRALYKLERQVKFDSLKAEWRERTMFLSSPTEIKGDPAFRAIVDMGQWAAPLILADVEKEPSMLVLALEEILGESPGEMGYNPVTWSRAWLQWAEAKGMKWGSRNEGRQSQHG